MVVNRLRDVSFNFKVSDEQDDGYMCPVMTNRCVISSSNDIMVLWDPMLCTLYTMIVRCGSDGADNNWAIQSIMSGNGEF